VRGGWGRGDTPPGSQQKKKRKRPTDRGGEREDCQEDREGNKRGGDYFRSVCAGDVVGGEHLL